MNAAALLGTLLAASPPKNNLCDPFVPASALALLLRERPPPPVDDENLLASRRACRSTGPRKVSSFAGSCSTENRFLTTVQSRNLQARLHLRPRPSLPWLSSHAGDKHISFSRCAVHE
jgi:hypothetical protein